jgi:hypothetical protein
MKTVEITYRYDAAEACAREQPADSTATRARLNEGSRSTAALLADLTLGAHTLQQEVTDDGEHEVRAAYGVYLIDERRVRAPRFDDAGVDGLAYPPVTVAEFERLADAVVRSQRIGRFLR